MRIAVFGSGGVGGYFGGRLQEAGEDVVFIARGRQLEALRSRGLAIRSPQGDITLERVSATDDPATAGEVDLLLVATKAWQVEEAAHAMVPMVGPKTTVLPLQNGIDAATTLGVVLGDDRVLTAMCRILAYIEEPGVIRHAGIEPTIVFGESDNSLSERVERILATLQAAPGVTAEIPEDIHVAVWVKFAMIASVSGLGSVTRAPLGVIRSVPETRRLLERSLEEVLAVARARGVAIPPDTFAKCFRFIDGLPADGTPSMQRDIAEGRPSEIEAQNGAVVRLGRQFSIRTPVNQFIYDVVRPLELRARGTIEFP